VVTCARGCRNPGYTAPDLESHQLPRPAKTNVVSFGVYDFEPHTEELRKEGMRIRLEGQPVAILKMLLERPGELVTREELQNKLWATDRFVDFDNSLNAAIKRLASGTERLRRSAALH
jgi:DNA-binding response OmpR family regulator